MSLPPWRYLVLDAIDVDLVDGQLRIDGIKRRRLSTKQLGLLRYLVDRVGQGASREALYQDVWGYHPRVSSRSLDTTICRLRTRLSGAEPSHDYLLTLRGRGYAFCPPGGRVVEGPREPGPATQLLARGDRLVTIVGADPASRQRAAWHALCAPLAQASPRWVYLGDTSAPTEIAARLAAGLGVVQPREQTTEKTRDLLASLHALPGRLVLVIDHGSRLLDTTRTLIQRWLGSTSNLQILVTSPRALELAGERCVPCPSATPPQPTPGRSALLAWAQARETPFSLADLEQAFPDTPDASEQILGHLASGELAVVRDAAGERRFRLT